MRVPAALPLACLLVGCTAEVVPVPEDCQVTVLEVPFRQGFEWRLRLLVLLDRRAPLPADVLERIAGIEGTFRTGDLDGDGTGDFSPPRALDVDVVETNFDRGLPELLAPHVPTGFFGAHTELFVVFVTAGDLPEPRVDEVDRALELHPVRQWSVATVAGVPPELAEPDLVSYEAILADPRMAPDAGPVCTTGGAEAFPGIAATRLASRFDEAGASSGLVSICAGGWEERVLHVLRTRGMPSIVGYCLPRPLPRLPDGTTPCRLVEATHPDDPRGCAHLPGRMASDEEPDRTCIVAQVRGPDDRDGWYYDDFSEQVARQCGAWGAQTFGFTPSFVPIEGASYELRCVTERGACAP